MIKLYQFEFYRGRQLKTHFTIQKTPLRNLCLLVRSMKTTGKWTVNNVTTDLWKVLSGCFLYIDF